MSDSPPPPRRRPPPPQLEESADRAIPKRPGPRPVSTRAATAQVPRRPAPPRPAGARPPPVPAASAGPARLVCTAGPAAGQEYPLEADEVVVGRASENAVSIPDTSVSRRHLALRRAPTGWVAQDLGSGNGTLLNGEAISTETPLAHGDVLTLGDTTFTFQAGAEATDRRPNPLAEVPVRRPPSRSDAARVRRSLPPEADPAAREKRKKVLAGALVGVVVLLGPLAFLKFQKDQQQRAEARAAQQLEQERQRLSALNQEGKNLMRDRKWAEAKARFEQIVAREPDYPGVKDYLAVLEREIPNGEQLAAAKKALEENRLAEAQKALGQVHNTLMHEEERQLKAELDRRAASRVADARGLLGSNDRKQAADAQAILQDVLAAFPEDRDAKLALEDAERLLATPERTAQVRAPTVARPKPWEAAVRLYMEGDLARAGAELNACARNTPRCKELLRAVNDFAALNRKVDSLDERGLTRLLQLDAQVTGGPVSSQARSAGIRAATAYYKRASTAKASGNWAAAGSYAQKALKVNPNHAESRRLLQELKERAKAVYFEGYYVKDTEPDTAREKFRQVVDMTSGEDEFHQKAKRWLSSLQE